MPTDCLVNIFERLHFESKLLCIPAICKHWYRAVKDPLCWQDLDEFLPYLDCCLYYPKRAQLMKLVVDLSQTCLTSLSLWLDASKEEVIYLSEAFPDLKSLELPSLLSLYYGDIFTPCIRWKNLEFIGIDDQTPYDCIAFLIKHVCVHLSNLTSLEIGSDIDDDVATTIGSFLPKLKYLSFILDVPLEKKHLLLILQGCKELVYVDVSQGCVGSEEYDDEILQLSCAIERFRCSGLKAKFP